MCVHTELHNNNRYCRNQKKIRGTSVWGSPISMPHGLSLSRSTLPQATHVFRGVQRQNRRNSFSPHSACLHTCIPTHNTPALWPSKLLRLCVLFLSYPYFLCGAGDCESCPLVVLEIRICKHANNDINMACRWRYRE